MEQIQELFVLSMVTVATDCALNSEVGGKKCTQNICKEIISKMKTEA
jgi:hypothetical protein